MGYPQPDPDRYALQDGTFFRLNTPLVSDGDIYESPQSSYGLAIGPDSDISKVVAAYYDDQQFGNLAQVAVTPVSPFPGFIAARNTDTYQPAGVKGRLLFWSDELWNPSFVPSGLAPPGGVSGSVVIPVLDVVQYFSPTQLPAQRNDKSYQYQLLPLLDDAVYFITLPYYGRKYASVVAQNNKNRDITFTLFGITYEFSDSPTAAIQTQLIAPTVIANSGGLFKGVTKASVDGEHHALLLRFVTPAGAPAIDAATTPIRIVVSDKET